MFYDKKGNVALVLKNALPPIGGRKMKAYDWFVCHKPGVDALHTAFIPACPTHRKFVYQIKKATSLFNLYVNKRRCLKIHLRAAYLTCYAIFLLHFFNSNLLNFTIEFICFTYFVIFTHIGGFIHSHIGTFIQAEHI